MLARGRKGGRVFLPRVVCVLRLVATCASALSAALGHGVSLCWLRVIHTDMLAVVRRRGGQGAAAAAGDDRAGRRHGRCHSACQAAGARR